MHRDIWVWAKGGLCNKWLAACAGLALSQRDGRRFVLCWPREAGAGKFTTPLGAEGFLSPQASFNDLWSNNWTQVTLEDWHKSYREDSASELGALTVPWTESSGTAVRVKARGYSFFCGKQSRHTQSVGGEAAVEIPDSSSDIEKYAKQFIPNTLVQARVDSIAPLIDAAPSVVGLAIRTVRAHPETYKRSPLSKFFEDLAAHFRQFPEAEVFISADEEKIVHMFVEKFPGHKFHYQSGALEWNSVESTQKALADLYLLACTDHFIGSGHSSFSGMVNVLRSVSQAGREVNLMERLYTGGTFDLFHYGHMHFLQQCRKICPTVIVSLNTDDFIRSYKGAPPIMKYEEREKSILWSGLATEVIPNVGGSDSKPAILTVNPDVICIGDDWASKDYHAQMGFTQEWLDNQGILLYYIPYCRDISTSEIKRRLQHPAEGTLFVICCKYSEEHSYIFQCVNSIQQFHPGCDIVVVDSDSKDTSYFDKLKDAGVSIEDVKNTAYEAGAWIHAFNKYKDSYQNFMFMQDSMYLNEPVDFGPLIGREILVHRSVDVGWSNDPPARRWAEQSYDAGHQAFTQGAFPEPETLVLYNSFAVSSVVMDEVLNSTAFKSWKVPDCKAGSCAWERIWQIVFDANSVTKSCRQPKALTKIFVGMRDGK